MRSNKHNIKVGDVFTTNYCGDVVVTYVNSSTDVGVSFDNGFSRSVTVGNLVKGKISNPTAPKVNKWTTRRRLTTESVIKSFVEKHGEKYDYSRVNYTDSDTPVLIGCKIHGFVKTTTFRHLNTEGCPECGKLKKRPTATFEDFVKNSRLKHGDRYSYFKDSYTKTDEQTKIRCEVHGDFYQQAASHLQGRGCPACGLLIMSETHKDSPEKFINKALKKHGDKYDLSLCEYTRHDVEVEVICRAHSSSFSIRPDLLLKGQGCPVCSAEKRSMEKRHTKEQFVEKAVKVHGNIYDYRLVDYITSKKNVAIICPMGHLFHQTPHNHTAGKHGCPSCGPCGFDARKDSWIYVLSAEGIVKIGITNRSAKTRAKTISKESGIVFKVEAEYKLDGQFCSDLETYLLKKYRLSYQRPSWVFQGSSECFLGLSVETIKSDIEEGIKIHEQKESLRAC